MSRRTELDSSSGREHRSRRAPEPPTPRTAERLRPETAAAVEAARAAGALLLAREGRPRRIRLKSAKDPVTEVDAAAERRIRALLRRRFPRIGFLGEEGSLRAGPDGRWIVDPLDGTIAFVAGLPFYAVLIALERQGILEAAVAYFPRLGELFTAERGRGTRLNGRRVAVSRRSRLRECVIALWHDDTVWGNPRLRERIAALALRVRNVRIFGAGYAMASVAVGRLDAYWEQSAHPWDLAAGALLVREAGGRVTTGAGARFDLADPTVLASNGRIHRRLAKALAPPRRERSR